MANVDIRVGKKDAAFFSANPTLILKDGQFLFNSDTLELFIGDGVTALSALPFLGSGGGGTQNLQEVADTGADTTTPLTYNGVELSTIEIQVTADLTAENDKHYVLVSSAVFTDPTPVTGKGYTILLSNLQTATVGGVAYVGTNGNIVKRYYIAGAWVTRSFYSNEKNVTLFSPIASPTFTGTVTTPSVIVNSETANTIASFDASKNIKSLVTATYPSLTELSYVKGLTSALQTQLDSKLTTSNNLSDVSNTITARNNLGIYDLYMTNGDQTTTSTTASNITDLVSATLTANKRYKINGLIRVGCNATGGVKLQITIPTGATMSVISDGNTGGAGGRAFNNITTSATLITNPVGSVNSANSYAIISGEISVGATAGVIQFGFASTTVAQTSTIYQLGTHLTLTQEN